MSVSRRRRLLSLLASARRPQYPPPAFLDPVCSVFRARYAIKVPRQAKILHPHDARYHLRASKRELRSILKQPVVEGVHYAPKASATALGLSAATLSRARAGPSGIRRPCSQFCSVARLTPIIRANSDCDFPSLRRIDLISAGRKVNTRAGLTFPRRIRPACRTLLRRSWKALSLT